MIKQGFAGALVAAAALVGMSTTAQAATIEIGAGAQIDANQAPSNAFHGSSLVQGNAAAPRTFAIPEGYGVITRWRHRTGVNSGSLTFKVYQPTEVIGDYKAVATETHSVTAGATESFDTRIPVQAGEVLGLSSTSGDVQEAYDGAAEDSVGVLTGDPGVGETASATPSPNYFLDVAARVESDADGDGYGDDTQDACPTDATLQTDCTPAETQFVTTPNKKVKTKRRKAKVRFVFSSPQEHVTFECSLDGGAYAACTSPFETRVSKGRHTFSVRAVNASGQPDSTPASYSFRVKRKRHHHHH